MLSTHFFALDQPEPLPKVDYIQQKVGCGAFVNAIPVKPPFNPLSCCYMIGLTSGNKLAKNMMQENTLYLIMSNNKKEISS